MKCQAVRPALSFLVDGQLPLTEWAIVQGHLRDCAECHAEFEGLRIAALARAGRRRRHATAAALAATVVVLVVAGGALYFSPRGLPDLSGPGLFTWPSWRPPPPRAAAPAAPAPARPAPVTPAPPSTPPPPRPIVEPVPPASSPSTAPTPAPVPRVARPASTAAASRQDRMPTQARPDAVLEAPPGAEAMPTQGLTPSRPRERR